MDATEAKPQADITASANLGDLDELMERRIKGDLRTQSGFEVKVAYGPEDVPDLDYQRDLGGPGVFPFTRGAYPRMYREKLWVRGVPPGSLAYAEEQGKTMAEAAAEMFEQGLITSGMRMGGDYHNLATIDPDHPLVQHDWGGCGVAWYSLWQVLEGRLSFFKDFLKQSVEHGFVMELGHAVGPADVCVYTTLVAALESLGLDPAHLRGNMVNDPLHVHITGCMHYKQPLEVGFKVAVDAMEYALRHTPLWRPTNGGCGYDMREAGIDTVQELAFRFGNYIEYTDALLARGVSFEEFGHRPTLAFSGEIDFFETVCKLRAARRIWARIARDRYGADPSRLRCPPCNTNLAGSSMTAQQPIFNIVRITLEALASVLGGVNGMEMKGYTEALTPPPPEAWVVNKGIEAILADEAGVALVADPLGGSYYVEWLTSKIEEAAMAHLQKILDQGGMIAAIRSGWVQGEAERAAQERQRELEERRKVKVGVNAYRSLASYPIPLPMLHCQRGTPSQPATVKHERETEEFREFQARRDLSQARDALRVLYQTARAGHNVIRPMIEAWKANASIGEVMGVIREGMGFPYDPFEMVPRPQWLELD